MRTRWFGLLTVLALLAAWAPPRSEAAQDPRGPAFVVVDVFVDAGAHRLAAWQVDVRFTGSKLVGVEGGESAAFRDAPAYDPAALQGGRVVLAALATAAEGATLPTGRVCVARLHLLAEGGALGAHTVRGIVAADEHGERFPADVEVRRHEDR